MSRERRLGVGGRRAVTRCLRAPLLLRVALVSAVFAPAAAVSVPAADVRPALAVIVHPATPTEDLSLAELRRIFRGERASWSGEVPVTLLVPAPGSAERATLLSRVYEKTEVQYRHYWIARLFSDEAASAPKVVASERMAAELVRGIEGAISVCEAARIPAGVKVLSVDDKTWDQPAYPLR